MRFGIELLLQLSILFLHIGDLLSQFGDSLSFAGRRCGLLCFHSGLILHCRHFAVVDASQENGERDNDQPHDNHG